MSEDTNHCTTNSTALPELLKPLGYKTHALGKWDVGFLLKDCTATYRGFDTFFGYYLARRRSTRAAPRGGRRSFLY